MKYLFHPRKFAIQFFFGLLITGFLGNVNAAERELLRFVKNPKLNQAQQHYYNVVLGESTTVTSSIAHVNFEELKDAERVELNLHDNMHFTAQKLRAEDAYANRYSWVGKLLSNSGEVHLVRNRDMLVGIVHTQDFTYRIRPLTGGLHAIILVDGELTSGCGNDQSDSKQKSFTKSYIESQIEHQDISEKNIELENRNSISTGECKIRYLAAYTTQVGSLLADPISELVCATDLANTGYFNSGVNHRLELCRAYETNYTESSSQMVDRNLFRGFGDGSMDEVHLERSLWNADMCGLLRVGGTGIAFIDNSFDMVFQVTNYLNISFHTWTHEIGHNHEATHNSSDGGVAPYQGWGDPINGCYRTIMAYPTACGTTSGDCERENVLSDNSILWYCNGIPYVPGSPNHRNADRHNLSTSTLVNHYTVSSSSIYQGDYDISEDEFVSHVASDDVGYNSISSNKFEIHKWGEGEFRASNSITLGEGFHAHDTSMFRAYLETCNSLVLAQQLVEESEKSIGLQINPGVVNRSGIQLKVFPNPFDHSLTVEFEQPNAGDVTILLYNSIAKEISRLEVKIDNTENARHLRQIDVAHLAPGAYYVTIISEGQRLTQKVMKL